MLIKESGIQKVVCFNAFGPPTVEWLKRAPETLRVFCTQVTACRCSSASPAFVPSMALPVCHALPEGGFQVCLLLLEMLHLNLGTPLV